MTATFMVINEICFQLLWAYYFQSWGLFFILPIASILALCGFALISFSFPKAYLQFQYHLSFLLTCSLLSIAINLAVRYYISTFSEVLREKDVDEINHVIANVSLPVTELTFTGILSTLIKPPVNPPAQSVPIAEYCPRLNATTIGRRALQYVHSNQTYNAPYILEYVLNTIRNASPWVILGIALISAFFLRKAFQKKYIDWFTPLLVVSMVVMCLPILDTNIDSYRVLSHIHEFPSPSYCNQLVDNYGTVFAQHVKRGSAQGEAILFVIICAVTVVIIRKPVRILVEHRLAEYSSKVLFGLLALAFKLAPLCSGSFVYFEVIITPFTSLRPHGIARLYQPYSFRAFFLLKLSIMCSMFIYSLPIHFPRTPVELLNSAPTEISNSALPRNNLENGNVENIEDTSQALLRSPAEVQVYTSLTCTQESQESAVESVPNLSEDTGLESLQKTEIPQKNSVGSLTTGLKQRNFLMREHENFIVNAGSLVLFALFLYALDTYFVWCFSLRFFSNDKLVEVVAFMLKIAIYSIVIGFIRYGGMYTLSLYCFVFPTQADN